VHEALRALDDADDATRCGRKAATLARLRGAGLPVPDGVVIVRDAAERLADDPDLEAAVLDEVVAGVAGPVAVRSSGLGEDLPDASHAGHRCLRSRSSPTSSGTARSR